MRPVWTHNQTLISMLAHFNYGLLTVEHAALCACELFLWGIMDPLTRDAPYKQSFALFWKLAFQLSVPACTTPYVSICFSVCLPAGQNTEEEDCHRGLQRHLSPFTSRNPPKCCLSPRPLNIFFSFCLSLSVVPYSLSISSPPMPLYLCYLAIMALSVYFYLDPFLTHPLPSVPQVHLAGCWGLTL